MRGSCLFCLSLLAVALLGVSAAFAADIVTLPTANQLKGNQLEVAYYRLDLDFKAPPSAAPGKANLVTAYWGITDRLELDAWWYDPDLGGSDLALNASFLVVPESEAMPSIVVGAQDITTALPTGKVSWFAATAKNLVADESRRFFPVVRLHAGVGSKQNRGVFGGIQAVIAGNLGLVVLRSTNKDLLGGRRWITGLTYTFPKTPLVIKAGTLGRHNWVGVAYTFSLPAAGY
ncbi:MAG: hypothetical protein ACUVRO_06070 [Armatimonadota bacterium]